MYEPQFWIDPDVYPFLVLWSLSTGFEVKTNEPHSLLYDIVCFDGIRCKELKAVGGETSLSREVAEQLVNNLKTYVGNDRELYAPDYHPPIKLHEDFSTDVFLPAVEQGGEYQVQWEESGIYHRINKVIWHNTAHRRNGDLFTDQIMCRNHVMGLIRELKHDATMAPFAVTYNLLKQRGGTTIIWAGNMLIDRQNADAVILREKERHTRGDWRVYTDVTDIAGKEEFLPPEFVRCEGWLWLRAYHPNEGLMGADYWEQGFYEDLGDLKSNLIEIQDQDIYAMCAIYACCHHEPLPEEEEPPILIINVKDLQEKRHNSDVETWPIMYRVVKPSPRTGYKGEIQEVAFGYIQEMETGEAVKKLTPMIKDHVARPPFMILIHRLERIEKIGG
ncbi:hypothetical protein LCGC14_1133420 [marine sediment metagenome]|uniref:Uncharacterized protein n=1 Tax=marine sediment metagenome TaxID=412755 RepID=A0A0F9M5C7_9ZZZZ